MLVLRPVVRRMCLVLCRGVHVLCKFTQVAVTQCCIGRATQGHGATTGFTHVVSVVAQHVAQCHARGVSTSGVASRVVHFNTCAAASQHATQGQKTKHEDLHN